MPDRGGNLSGGAATKSGISPQRRCWFLRNESGAIGSTGTRVVAHCRFGALFPCRLLALIRPFNVSHSRSTPIVLAEPEVLHLRAHGRRARPVVVLAMSGPSSWPPACLNPTRLRVM